MNHEGYLKAWGCTFTTEEKPSFGVLWIWFENLKNLPRSNLLSSKPHPSRSQSDRRLTQPLTMSFPLPIQGSPRPSQSWSLLHGVLQANHKPFRKQEAPKKTPTIICWLLYTTSKALLPSPFLPFHSFSQAPLKPSEPNLYPLESPHSSTKVGGLMDIGQYRKYLVISIN